MIADVRGKKALIVGATRGIGNAVARRFSEEGAVVGITGRDESAARTAAASIGPDVRGYGFDVRDAAAAGAAVERFAADAGPPDALVYSAGISPVYTSAEKLDAAAWDDIIATNVTGAFLTAQAFAREAIARAKPATITFVGSIAGIAGAGRLAGYSASKAALVGLAKSMALDWARHRIRVNVIAPGWVDTDMTAGMRQNEALRNMIVSRTPQARMASASEIADLAVFLASESASFATGSVYPLDGGWTSG